MPIAICPSIMLSSVKTKVVAPRSIGMARAPWCGSGGLTEPAQQRCNGRRIGFIPPGESENEMPVLFVARSSKLARWASDVGFGKHLYKIGISEDDPKALAAAGWA